MVEGRRTKITLHSKRVKSGAHSGQYHMVAAPGAVKRAARRTGRTKGSISSGIQTHKKKRHIQGYRENADAFPAKKVIALASVQRHTMKQAIRKNFKKGLTLVNRDIKNAQRAEAARNKRQDRAEARAARPQTRSAAQKHQRALARTPMSVEEHERRRIARAAQH